MAIVTPTFALLLLLVSIASSHAFRCSVSTCSYFGAREMCCPSTPCLPIACAVWHAAQSPQLCDFPCPATCSPPSARPLGTDAIAYCNNCTLARTSCNHGFDIHGPIDHGLKYAVDVERSPTPTHRAVSTPATTPDPVSILPSPAPYQSPETSRGSDYPQSSHDVFEFSTDPSPEETPVVDVTPYPTTSLPTCSVEFCTMYGALAECSDSSRALTICANWSPGGHTAQCPRNCTSRCYKGLSAPLASDGRRYCSLCHLRLISCLSGYTITGPVNAPPNQPVPSYNPVQVVY